MKANYHTHTARCGHAEGTDEEYVLAAIERGFDELGFSDHVPWPYKNGYVHPTVRMHISQMPEYLASVRALAEKYGVSFLTSEFRKRDGYKRSLELSREYGLYRQDYCGCVFSRREREKSDR